MVGQVLLHTGAKAEMRAFPGENHNLELWSIPQVLEGRSQSCQHGLVDDVGFGRSQCNAGDLAIVFEGEFQAAHRPAFVVSRAAATDGGTPRDWTAARRQAHWCRSLPDTWPVTSHKSPAPRSAHIARPSTLPPPLPESPPAPESIRPTRRTTPDRKSTRNHRAWPVQSPRCVPPPDPHGCAGARPGAGRPIANCISPARSAPRPVPAD